MRNGTRTYPRLLAVAAVVVLALVGCGAPKLPAEAPGIVGVIEDVQTNGDTPSILVVGGKQAPGAVSDRAMCRVTGDTTIVDAAGAEVGPEALTEGATVAVWFTGAVAESYPVQGTAGFVEIRSKGN